MKKIFYLTIMMALLSCISARHTDNYFEVRSFNEIEHSMPMKSNIKLVETSIDYHFPEVGSIVIPISDIHLKYDTLSHYKVVLFGKVTFKLDEDGYWDTEKFDSVYLESIAVMKRNSGVVFTNIGNKNLNNLKNCPIPISILNELKEDFFTLCRYRKFIVPKENRDWNLFQISYVYHLW